MGRMDIGDKAMRVLKLLMGLRNPRVLPAMEPYGFGPDDLKEGWHLLEAASATKLDTPPKVTRDSSIIEQLDAWENHWFPIAGATLARRFPAVHAELFKNLSQTSGPAVVVSVQTFVQRFDEMAAGQDPYGSDGKAARKLLAARGLTKAVLDEARELLEGIESVHTVESVDVDAIEQDKEQLAKAEEALWQWYLEWSQIARVVVTERSLRRELGFNSTRSKSKDDESGDHTDPAPAPVPVPSPAPAPAPVNGASTAPVVTQPSNG